jgi:hypothetical protein
MLSFMKMPFGGLLHVPIIQNLQLNDTSGNRSSGHQLRLDASRSVHPAG